MPDNDLIKARFVKGLLLAWVPLIVVMVPLLSALFRALAPQKATGVGAVAGGISESLVTFGLVSLVVSQVLALFFLGRTFQKGHALRGVFSVISICCSVLLLSIAGTVVWMLIRYVH